MEDLAQHILDIAINSLEAGATVIDITIIEDTTLNVMKFIIQDNGRGIGDGEIQKLTDPFYTTKKQKHVGLGVPLFYDAVQMCGGQLEIKALPGGGTVVKAVLPHDHLDRAPLGDIAGTLITILAGHDDLELKYSHRCNEKDFSFATTTLKNTLEGIPLQSPAALLLVEDYLSNMIADLRRDTGEEFGRTEQAARKAAAGDESPAK